MTPEKIHEYRANLTVALKPFESNIPEMVKTIRTFAKDNSIGHADCITIMLNIVNEVLQASGVEALTGSAHDLNPSKDQPSEEEERFANEKLESEMKAGKVSEVTFMQQLKVILRGTRWGLYENRKGLEKLRSMGKEKTLQRLSNIAQAVQCVAINEVFFKYWKELAAWMQISHAAATGGVLNFFSGAILKDPLPTKEELSAYYLSTANNIPIRIAILTDIKLAVPAAVSASSQSDANAVISTESSKDQVKASTTEEKSGPEFHDALSTLDITDPAITSKENQPSLNEPSSRREIILRKESNRASLTAFSIFPKEISQESVRFNLLETYISNEELTPTQIHIIMNFKQDAVTALSSYANAWFRSNSYVPNISLSILGVELVGRPHQTQVSTLIEDVSGCKDPKTMVKKLYIAWQSVQHDKKSEMRKVIEKILNDICEGLKPTVENVTNAAVHVHGIANRT